MKTAAAWRIVLLGIVGTLLPACGEEPPAEEVVRSIKTVTVSRRPMGQQRRFTGVLAATDKSELSFRVDGRVLEVAVDQGSQVRSGQLLASIESEPYQLALETAIADLLAARATLAEMEKKLESTQKLVERKIGSERALDVAEAAHGKAEGRVQSAEASVNLAQRDLDNTIIVAPFDGLIAERRIEPFQEISSGETVLVLHNEGAVEVDLNIPEGLIYEVQVGQPVTVHLTTAAFRRRSFPGRVMQVGTTALAANSYPVTVAVEEGDPRMRPGMTARVEFIFHRAADAKSWLLPTNAVLPADGSRAEGFFEGEAYVFVYRLEEGAVEKRPVRVSGMNDRYFEISEGLAEGEVVAVAGVHFLRDGLEVDLFEAEPDGTGP